MNKNNNLWLWGWGLFVGLIVLICVVFTKPTELSDAKKLDVIYRSLNTRSWTDRLDGGK